LTFARLCARVREHIGQEHRYEHCVRVARFAEQLAFRHGESPARARIAGMLHDLARLYSADRLLKECEARKMPVDFYEGAHPIVLHARLGERLASEMFGIDDPAVLSAIRKHTLADAQMSALDCILYVADAAEPGRSFPQRAALASLAMRDLTEATRATLAVTAGHVRAQGFEPAPKTLAAMRALGVDASAVEELSGRSA